MINIIAGKGINYLGELTRVRVCELFINISNNPELSTDYSYLVDMLKVDDRSYGSLNNYDGKEGTVVSIDLALANDLNEEVIVTFIKLLNVLGYEQFMTLLRIFKSYDIELD
jgi:hypothetical protein